MSNGFLAALRSRLSRRRLAAALAAVLVLLLGLAQLVPWVAMQRDALIGRVAWAMGSREVLILWSSADIETPIQRCGFAFALAATEAGLKVSFDMEARSIWRRRVAVDLDKLQLGAPFAFDDPSMFTAVNQVGSLADAIREGTKISNGWVNHPMRVLSVAYGESIHLVGGGKPILGPNDLTGRRLLLRRPTCQRDEFERLAQLLTVEECAHPEDQKKSDQQALPAAEADRVVWTASVRQAAALPQRLTGQLSLAFARIVGVSFIEAIDAGSTDEQGLLLRDIARKAALVCGRANYRAEREGIEALRARGTRVFLPDRAAFHAASRNILTNKLADARDAADTAEAADKEFRQRLAEVYQNELTEFDTLRRSWAP